MSTTNSSYHILLQELLPKELFNYFEIISVKVDEHQILVFLDECNIYPENYKSKTLLSKGFTPATIVQDFPIRNKAVYLHIRRRKWLVKETSQIISNTWDLTDKGTKHTKEFADFLKELFGSIPN